MNKYLRLAFSTYIFWGLFPVFWKLLHHFSALEILSHRIIWSFAFYSIIYFGIQKKSFNSIWQIDRKSFLLIVAASALITVNWLIYIWAVNAGHIIEGSLAYFITPLLNMVMGVYFFQDPWTRLHKIASLCALVGVLMKGFLSPQFPWIALSLALTFSSYGMIKKMLKVPALLSSTIESGLGLVFAIPLVIFFRTHNTEPLTYLDGFLLMMSGVVTALPLWFFSLSAQFVPFTTIGFIQFISPTLQFLVGYFAFDEGSGVLTWLSFIPIWAGVGIYVMGLLTKNHRKNSSSKNI